MKFTEDLIEDIRTFTQFDDRDWSLPHPHGYGFRGIDGNGNEIYDAEVTDCNRYHLLEQFNKIRDNAKAILEIGIGRNSSESFCHVFFNNKKKETIYVGINLDDRSFLRDPENNIHVIQNNSSSYNENLNTFKQIGVEKFDFIFIDGWHSINQVLSDWEYTNLLADGGIVGFHDTSSHPGPKIFLEHLDKTKWDVIENCCPQDYGVGFVRLKKKIKIEEFTICLHCGCSREVVDNQMKLLKPLEEKYKVYWNNRIDRHPEIYNSYSKLINHSISTSPTEWVILINDRTLPTVEEVEKMIDLLESGYACVLLYNVGFMGFSKELIRKIGWWDERFTHSGWEDRDWIWRIYMNNLGLYESQESTYVNDWQTPLKNTSSESTFHWNSKYTQLDEIIIKQLPEERYVEWEKTLGDSIPEISNSWKSWNYSKLNINYDEENRKFNGGNLNPFWLSGSKMLNGRKIIENYE